MMEEVLAEQLEELRAEQAKLESELLSKSAPSMSHQQQQQGNKRGVEDLSAATNHTNSASEVPANMFPTDAQNIHERVEELEKLKRRYQHGARDAMRRYLALVNDNAGYQAQRQARLQSARPMSFERRELLKGPSIRARRVEADQAAREEALQQALQHRFTATPVPPTTFMNKYELMVEEWCQRKAAVELLAREKANRAKEARAFVRLSAESLRHTREELHGIRYGRDGKPISRSVLRQRAVSAEARRQRQAQHAAAGELPLESRMRLWPALEEQEQVRRERIQRRAEKLRAEYDASARAALPLLTSPTPEKLGDDFANGISGFFGIGLPVGPAAQSTAPPPVNAPLTAAAPPPAAPVSAVAQGAPAPPASAAVSPPPLGTGGPAAAGDASPPPPSNVTAAPVGQPALDSHAPSVAAKVKTEASRAQPRREAARCEHNAHLTFKPKVHPGVPDYEALWAAERLALAERKVRHTPTVVKAFHLTPSAKDERVTGQRPASRRAPSSRRGKAAEHPPRTSPTPPSASAEAATAAAPPKGTRAHALRTKAVFDRYVHQAAAAADVANTPEAVVLKAAAQRRREVSQRLKAYLTDVRADYNSTIAAKVRRLRASMKAGEQEAQERLEAMKQRVAQMPPVFVEPTQLQDMAQARAAAERDILGLLKESGLDGAAIRQILSQPEPSGGETPEVPEVAAPKGGEVADGTAAAPSDNTAGDTSSPHNNDVPKPSQPNDRKASGSASSGSSSDNSSSSSSTGRPKSTDSSRDSSDSSKQSLSSASAASPKTQQKPANTNQYDEDSFESSSAASDSI